MDILIKCILIKKKSVYFVSVEKIVFSFMFYTGSQYCNREKKPMESFSKADNKNPPFYGIKGLIIKATVIIFIDLLFVLICFLKTFSLNSQIKVVSEKRAKL